VKVTSSNPPTPFPCVDMSKKKKKKKKTRTLKNKESADVRNEEGDSRESFNVSFFKPTRESYANSYQHKRFTRKQREF
jgi:hypothetical protein